MSPASLLSQGSAAKERVAGDRGAGSGVGRGLSLKKSRGDGFSIGKKTDEIYPDGTRAETWYDDARNEVTQTDERGHRPEENQL